MLTLSQVRENTTPLYKSERLGKILLLKLIESVFFHNLYDC